MGYSDALTAALLNNLRPATIQSIAPSTVSLSQGQLIRATVQQVNDQTVLLNIAGQLISAKTEIPLQPRQQVLLNVTQAGPDQISLQVLEQTPTQTSAANTNGASIPPATTLENLQTLLSSWGVEADTVNTTLAQGLLTHAQTLNPQDLQSARMAWLSLSGDQPANMEAVAFLQANNLPLNEESVSLATQWLNGLPPVANRLATLQQSISNTLAQLQQAGQNNPQTAQLSQMLQNTLLQINAWHITPNTSTAEIAARLETLIVNLSTPPEANLAQQSTLVITQNTAQSPQNGTAPTSENQPAPLPATAENGQTMPQSIDGKNGVTTKAPASNGQTVVAPPVITTEAKLNPLHQLAKAVTDTLANANLTPQQSQSLHQLSHQLHALNQDLGAAQLSNLASHISNEVGQYYLFPVPLNNSDGSQSTAQLKMYRHGGKTKINPEDTRLALLLDLPSLGEIAIDLTLFKRQITGRVMSGQAETNTLVSENIADLQDRLTNIGYHVETIATSLLADETDADEVTQTHPTQHPLNLSKIDFNI